MPRTTPATRFEAVKGQARRAILHSESFDEAYTHARQLEAEKGLIFIHPYDDSYVIAGKGTVGMQILR
jgi:threonine dehydratase